MLKWVDKIVVRERLGGPLFWKIKKTLSDEVLPPISVSSLHVAQLHTHDECAATKTRLGGPLF